MNLIIKKYKYFNECINNPTFASKVYLELLNRNTELDMTFDEFDEIMNETYEKFLNENIDYLEIALNEEKGKSENPIVQMGKTVSNGVGAVVKGVGSAVQGAKDAASHVKSTAAHADEAVGKVNNLLDANKDKVSSTLSNTEEVTKKVNKMVDDNKGKVDSTLTHAEKISKDVNDVTGDFAKRYKNTTAKIDKTKAHFKKHGKKYVAGGAAVAATAITVKAVKKAKDKKKYQAWKAKNPKERQYIGMKQWIDLGRPLDEATSIFIDGYFDAILENLE
ncbi:MAG TPA: hypothetical protein PK507_04990 [bacterium]|nr:hypothetical protein [bacterium]